MEQYIRQKLAKPFADPFGDKKHYAVLLPLIQRQSQWHLLFQVRSSQISQPGDTAFPGGRLEPGESFQEAAIRECCEELCVDSDQIEIIGELGARVNDFSVIHAYVGLLKTTDFDCLQPNPAEVAYLFTVPLTYFLEVPPTYYEVSMVTQVGEDFPYHLLAQGSDYQFSVGKRKIPFYNLPNGEYLWGYTANITHQFAQLLHLPDNE